MHSDLPNKTIIQLWTEDQIPNKYNLAFSFLTSFLSYSGQTRSPPQKIEPLRTTRAGFTDPSYYAGTVSKHWRYQNNHWLFRKQSE